MLRTRLIACVASAAVVLAGCGGASPVTAAPTPSATPVATATASPSPAPPKDIVAAGKIRIAYRVQGNLIKKDATTGAFTGVIPDLAAELAKRMGVKIEATDYPTTDAVLAAAKAGAFDITFDTIDTTKAEIEFTTDFVDIPLTYLVPAGSKITKVADVDQAGVRIAVLKGDTVDRFLTSSIKSATITRYDTDKLRNDALASGAADVLPGSLTALIPTSQTIAGSKILDGAFLVNRWSIAVPKGSADMLRYANAFITDVRASGFVKTEIETWKLVGVTVGGS